MGKKINTRNKNGTYKSLQQMEEEFAASREAKRQARLINTLDRTQLRFNRLFPNGEVTAKALWKYYSPPAALFALFLPDKLKAAYKEGARYVARRFVQRPDIHFAQFAIWRHDRIQAYNRQKYRMLLLRGDPYTFVETSTEESARYHAHMLRYFVQEFNHKKKPAKKKVAPSVSPMLIGDAIEELQARHDALRAGAAAAGVILTHRIRDDDEGH